MQWISRAAPLVLLVSLSAGCGDSTGIDLDPNLVTDTVVVAAPLPQNAALPTALDITSNGAGGVWGGRFPELSRDALQWDFLVVIREGRLALLSARSAGITNSRAAMTPPVEGETFESLRETPGQSTFVTKLDSVVVMETGKVYAARSRETSAGFGFGGCVQFAKLEPLEVNVAAGTLRLQIVTNQFCGDTRLVPVD